MEDFEYRALLFDFYGNMLTEGQRTAFEEHVIEDLTVSEIAQNREVSRQAASDLLKRTERILKDYEAKLHLVEKFLNIRQRTEGIDKIARERGEDDILALTREILEEL